MKIPITSNGNVDKDPINCFSDEVENSKWNEFVESIKSKLTVKQVVDGVRSGGNLTFDYLLLIVTAEFVYFEGESIVDVLIDVFQLTCCSWFGGK